MTDTYETAVVAVCPQGHREANLLAQFEWSGTHCARCNGKLTIERQSQVKVHLRLADQTGHGGLKALR